MNWDVVCARVSHTTRHRCTDLILLNCVHSSRDNAQRKQPLTAKSPPPLCTTHLAQHLHKREGCTYSHTNPPSYHLSVRLAPFVHRSSVALLLGQHTRSSVSPAPCFRLGQHRTVHEHHHQQMLKKSPYNLMLAPERTGPLEQLCIKPNNTILHTMHLISLC